MAKWLILVWVLLTAPLVEFLLGRGSTWATMLGYHAGCLLMARWLGPPQGQRIPPPRLILWVALSSFLIVLGAGLAAAHFLLPDERLSILRDRLRQWGVGQGPWLLAYYSLVNPFIEERFWRVGLLGAAVMQSCPTWGRWLLATVGFGLYHAVVLVQLLGLHAGLVAVLGVVGAAFIWSLLYEYERGGRLCSSSHLGADLGTVALYYLLLSG